MREDAQGLSVAFIRQACVESIFTCVTTARVTEIVAKPDYLHEGVAGDEAGHRSLGIGRLQSLRNTQCDLRDLNGMGQAIARYIRVTLVDLCLPC